MNNAEVSNDSKLKSLFMNKGYTIRSVNVRTLETANGSKDIVIVELESKNYLENKHIFRLMYRNFSDYETGIVEYLNDTSEQYLLEKITIPKNGTLNHTIGAFNVPPHKALKSIEIQTELSIISLELSNFIVKVFA